MPQADTGVRTIAAEKWRGALDAGFQIVPNVLIRAQAKLRLDTLDLAILLNVNLHWWTAEDLPYPRTSVIANRVGASVRTMERRLESLQKAGLIARLPPEKTKDALSVRRFDLSGLVARLETLASTNLEICQRGYYAGRFDGEDEG